MPIITDDTTPEIADVAKTRRERRAKPSSATTPKVSVSQNQMLGIGDRVRVGGLSLVLCAPTIREGAELDQKIYFEWPDLLVMAAMDRDGRGIDPHQVADIWTINIQAASKESGEEVVPVTPLDVRSRMIELGTQIRTGMFTGIICDTLWKLAKSTPGLAWPRPEDEEAGPPTGTKWLDDALFESLTIPDLADLLRAMFAAMGGFTGDITDRFETL